MVPRYYTPEALEAPARAGATPATSLALRIGRVGGSSYLKERMAYRDAEHEFGFYDDKRWTERPEVYLLRALERSLFEERGVKRALSSDAPTLTVDLIEFEEVRGSAPRVRLQVSYALHDDRAVFRERTFVLERPLTQGTDSARADRVAAGLGQALRDAVTRIVDEVVAELSAGAAGRP
jgi:hypothetical protein